MFTYMDYLLNPKVKVDWKNHLESSSIVNLISVRLYIKKYQTFGKPHEPKTNPYGKIYHAAT